jgi:hypothetical protein
MFSITENGNTIFLINISHHEPGLGNRFLKIFVALYETGLITLIYRQNPKVGMSS